MDIRLIAVDLQNAEHCFYLIQLLNEYMEDEMGIGESMPEDLGPKIIEGLRNHKSYLGFFACIGDDYVGLANCNLNFSTWKAKSLINIHDLFVSPKFRERGVGFFLLKEIEKFAAEHGCCRINLEVRHDNFKAQQLYKKAGFDECEPNNFFWENKF